MLLKEEGDIQMSFDKNNVLFRLKNSTLICRLIEGNYPNYNAVIPAANPNKMLIDRIEGYSGPARTYPSDFTLVARASTRLAH